MVEPVRPRVRLDDVVRDLVHVGAEAAGAAAARGEVARAVPCDGGEPRLVERRPHRDGGAQLPETDPGVLLEPEDALGVEPSTLRW